MKHHVKVTWSMLVIFCHRATTLGHYDLFDDFEDDSDYDEMKSDDMGDYYGDTDFDYDYEGDAKKENNDVFYDHDYYDEFHPDLDEMGNPIDSSHIALPWEFADDMSKIYKEEL